MGKIQTNTTIVQMPIDAVKPYPNNPRINKDAIGKVAESIRAFGFEQPIVVDKDKVIIVGHTRLEAAKRLKLKEVPVIVADHLTDEQARAYRLADNKTNEFSLWDTDLLISELDDITDIDMGLFGFDFGDDEEEETGDVTEDEMPDIPEEPISKPGDLYQLGEHRLICGDSTDVNVIERLLNGQKVDVVFTDPPYGMNLDTDFSSMKSKLGANLEGGSYEQGKVDEFHPEMVDTVFTIDAEEVFLWGADYFAEFLPNKNDGSWIVWDKRANGDNDDIDADYSSDKMYGSCFELCWSKKKHKRDIARVKWAGIFGLDNEFDHKRVHPTQKPVKLVDWFLSRYSKKGDLVVDIFGGSGSTLIACEQTGRKCYMSELDPHYVDVIVARWENLTGKKAVLIEGGIDDMAV